MINIRLRNYFVAEGYSEAALGFHMYGSSIDDRTYIQFPQPHLRFESILFICLLFVRTKTRDDNHLSDLGAMELCMSSPPEMGSSRV